MKMGGLEKLFVRVNDELVLDAGTCELISSPSGPEWLIRPPSTTLFHQVLNYLKTKPDPPKRPTGSTAAREGIVATMLVLRWGSYLSVLLDHDKPIWSEVHSERTSRISDDEMARVNIEASAALAEWIDLYRKERGNGLYAQLVNRAGAYLPTPKAKKSVRPNVFAKLGEASFACQLVELADAQNRTASIRADVELHASRVFANALLNTAWRNGPVEDIHAGRGNYYPLDQRRVTLKEEKELIAITSARMASGMATCWGMIMEHPKRPWSEQVLPYALAELLLITPSGWSLTESSREVRLPEGKPPEGLK